MGISHEKESTNENQREEVTSKEDHKLSNNISIVWIHPDDYLSVVEKEVMLTQGRAMRSGNWHQNVRTNLSTIFSQKKWFSGVQ